MTIFTTIKFVSQQACRRVHEWVESTVGLLVDMVYKMRVWALILVYNVSRVFWGVFLSRLLGFRGVLVTCICCYEFTNKSN